jgi:PilZ domain-containing protein
MAPASSAVIRQVLADQECEHLMKRLVWADANGVRGFGCAGCGWIYPVKEFTPEFSETKVREEFQVHDCASPQFKFEDDASSTLPVTADLASWSLNSGQLLRDLCGLKGAVLAGIEALSWPAPSNQDMAAIKRELDSVRSLLWLHMHAAQMPSQDSPQSSANEQERRWRRYDFQVPVTLTRSNGNKKIRARGTNLNEGGITVSAEAELALREELKVEFTPPFSTTAVNLSAIVKDRIDNCYGMEFIGANGAELQEILLLRTIVKMLEARVRYYDERETRKVPD